MEEEEDATQFGKWKKKKMPHSLVNGRRCNTVW